MNNLNFYSRFNVGHCTTPKCFGCSLVYCHRSCVLLHHYHLNNIFFMHTTSIFMQSTQQLFLWNSSKNINAWKYSCNLSGVVRNIAWAIEHLSFLHSSRIFWKKKALLTRSTNSFLFISTHRNMWPTPSPPWPINALSIPANSICCTCFVTISFD